MKTPTYLTCATYGAFFAVCALVSPVHATNRVVNTSTEKSSGFATGTIDPFSTCTTLPANRGVVTTLNGQPCVKFQWHEANYNGTRTARGTEACSALAIEKEGWYGFYIYLPNPGFPMNKKSGIAQWFADNSACNSWMGMLDMVNNDLTISHRGNCGTPTTAVVYPNFPRNRWVSIIAHVVVSHQNAGHFEVFVDGVSHYNAKNINFGFDKWTSSDALQAPVHIGLKFGQYDFDAGNFDKNEVRTSYYTNVTQVVGNPSGVLEYIRNPIPGSPTNPGPGPKPVAMTYQAESAVVAGGAAVESKNVNFIGKGYVNFSTAAGTLTFEKIDGQSGGARTLEIRYALGVPAARTGQLVVNGVTTSINFSSTGDWSKWAVKTVPVKLNVGTANIIQFKSTGNDLANIDEITLR